MLIFRAWATCAFADKIDCKTVRIFAYSSTREQSNKRSVTRLKTESETGRVRLARFSRERLLRPALPISLLILRKKKTDCFAVYWQKKIYFSYSDPGGTLENKLNDLKPIFSRKKSFAFQNTDGQILPTRINNNHRKLICMSRTIHDFSVWDIASPVGVFRGDRISSLQPRPQGFSLRLQLEYQVYLWGRGGRRREKRKEETANFSLPWPLLKGWYSDTS